jgi:hypothetical protein
MNAITKDIKISSTKDWHTIDWKYAFDNTLTIQDQLVVAAEEGD